MSSYEVGAFEALEWAWNLLRSTNGATSPDDAVTQIQEILYTLGTGSRVNFQSKISEIKAPA